MLKIEGLSFSYGEQKVIDDLSLTLPERGVYAVMGPSGCGKSTLFSLIAGLEKPDSGRIELDTKKLAFSFQDARLLPWLTAAENVNFVLRGKKNTFERARTALNEVGLGEDTEKYPDELSGGMKKRVSLARAFVTDSDFILLDEPMNGLDSETKRSIIGKIKNIGKSALVLLITHDMEEATECADVIYDFYSLMERRSP